MTFNSWESLEKECEYSIYQNIRTHATLDEVNELYFWIESIHPKEKLRELANFQDAQEQLGAWVKDFFPD